MKKVFVITMALVAFNISAQNITYGAKTGLNFATMVGEDAEGLDGRTSFHLGFTAEIEISDTFSIQPELLYSSQGFKQDIDDESDTAKVDYINLPVMAKFYVGNGFSLEAGPQIGFLVSAESDGEDVKEFLESTDFALNLGAGYKINSKMNIGLRYSMGLTDAVKDDEEGDDYDFKHSVFLLSFGYSF
jgi:hypothetical protein